MAGIGSHAPRPAWWFTGLLCLAAAPVAAQETPPPETEAPPAVTIMNAPAEPAPSASSEAAPAVTTSAAAVAPAATGENGALVIEPSARFGLLVEDAHSGQPDALVGAGLAVAWRYQDLAVKLEGGWQQQERTYLAEGADLAGGAPLVRVDEHGVHVGATFHYDFAPMAGLDFRDVSFGPYGGLLGRQLINDVYPSLLAGLLVGAEAGIDVGRGLRFDAGVDYTHHIGRFFLDDALGEVASRHGKQLGWLRWRGAFSLFQDNLTALSLGYRGSWLALEHTQVYDHTADLTLRLALPL